MSPQKQQEPQVDNLGGFCFERVNFTTGICSTREDVCYGWMGYSAQLPQPSLHVSLVMVISELVTC